jgi:hypothetical protein
VIKVYLQIVQCCGRRRGLNIDPYLQQWDQTCRLQRSDLVESEIAPAGNGVCSREASAISFAVTAIHLIPLIPARLSGHFFCLLSSEYARKGGLIMRDQ